MLDKLRNLFGGGQSESTPQASPSAAPQRPSARRPAEIRESTAMRQSRGLEQFFFHIRDLYGLSILDLAGANQDNVTFITGAGHRLYSGDVLRGMNEFFPNPEDQSNPGLIEGFVNATLGYEEGSMDGALIWDCFEYMSPPLLSATLDRLSYIMRPGSYLLAFFHSDDKVAEVPHYTFRIASPNSLKVTQSGLRKPQQTFNNRSLERLFLKFDSVKFFLTREALREVIVKR